jgi:opine dehydrogenase
MAEAVEGAEVVLIAALASRHAEIAAELAPLLKPGQTVLFSAGNCGSIILKKTPGLHPEVVVGEMSGNVLPCRIVGRARVFAAFPYRTKNMAAFPAVDNERLLAAVAGVYDGAALSNVLEAALNSPNVVVHLAGSILNTCGIDRHPDFRLYTDGLSEHVLKVVEAVEAEKIKVMEAMGYKIVRHAPFMRQLAQYGQFPEFDGFRSVSGPSAMDHRYITEDAAFGQSLLRSLAGALKIDLPVSLALMTLAGTINGRDYFATGLTLEKLGLGGMKRDEINQYLRTGQAA